jgi:hypothetical protein
MWLSIGQLPMERPNSIFLFPDPSFPGMTRGLRWQFNYELPVNFNFLDPQRDLGENLWQVSSQIMHPGLLSVSS